MRRVLRALRIGFVVAAGSCALALPASAAPFDSTTEELIRTLNQELLYIAVPITVLVEGILIYTVLRFRSGDDGDDGEAIATRENRRLEITWTVATALVLLFVGVASYQVLAHPSVGTTWDGAADGGGIVGEEPDGDAVAVNVTGYQWFWSFEHVGENVTSQGQIVLPANQTVVLRLTSANVIHSFHAPELGLKQDLMPGQYTAIRTELTSPGTYQLYCAEYCGTGHSAMLGTIEVVSGDEYQQYLEQQRSEARSPPNATSDE